MTNKQKVLKRYPNAYCHMSLLSGMFFVKTGYTRRKIGILAYEEFSVKAWKEAALTIK